MADIFTGRLREEIPAALTHLLGALLQCPKLHTVNLCDNAFGPTAAEPLEDFFAKHTPLKHLYLQNNGMGPEAGAKMAQALAANTEAQLETLICGRNRLENGSCSSWVKCFTQHAETLKTVKMPQNGIRPEGIESLMRDGLSQCKALECLDMQDNTFTQRGSAALAAALPKWTALKELAVGDCLLSARGGINVFEALREGNNKAIETLRLQYNEIDAKGLQALVLATEQGLPAVVLIELNGNKFSEEDESIEKLQALFEERGAGELDELDDLEEDSDEEEEGAGDDEAEEDGKEEADERKPSVSALDDAIERNLAAALNATSLTSS
jgi:Ran GTPase-activating protein 1